MIIMIQCSICKKKIYICKRTGKYSFHILNFLEDPIQIFQKKLQGDEHTETSFCFETVNAWFSVWMYAGVTKDCDMPYPSSAKHCITARLMLPEGQITSGTSPTRPRSRKERSSSQRVETALFIPIQGESDVF